MSLLFTKLHVSHTVVTHTDAGYCRDLPVGDIYKYWDMPPVFEVVTNDGSVLRFNSSDLRLLANKLDQLNKSKNDTNI